MKRLIAEAEALRRGLPGPVSCFLAAGKHMLPRFLINIGPYRASTRVTSRTMATSQKIALAQMTSTSDTAHNLDICTRLAREAKTKGCLMLFLPENFAFIGPEPGAALLSGLSQDLSKSLPGSLIHSYRSMAKEVSIWLSLGGMQTIGPDEGHSFNTHILIDDAGEIQALYNKMHLFDVDVPNGPVLLESRFAAPGTRAVCADTPIGRLGMMVCYDLRFPSLSQHLTFDQGAEILTYPSAFTRPTGEAHWEVLLRARAIESQCYVIAAAQAGCHNEKRESYGHSMVIDPWGKIIAQLEDPLQTGIAVCEIDLHQIRDIRAKMPISEHRKRGFLT